MLRSFFIGLSTNKPFRKFSENSSIGRRVSHRFVAGMTIEEALAAAQPDLVVCAGFMRVLSAPRQLQGISAFDLEIESYVGEDG